MEPIKLDLDRLKINTPLLKGSASYQEQKSVPSFSESLEKAMNNLKDVNKASEQLMQDFASGKDVDVAQVMVALEKTSTTTELAMQVRNKIIEGYQELIRMQI